MTQTNPTKVIKKYTNRKLYDTEESSYVSLKKIVEFISSGREVQVIDNETKADITNQTLLSAIVERETDVTAEIDTLKGIIQAGSIQQYVTNATKASV